MARASANRKETAHPHSAQPAPPLAEIDGQIAALIQRRAELAKDGSNAEATSGPAAGLDNAAVTAIIDAAAGPFRGRACGPFPRLLQRLPGTRASLADCLSRADLGYSYWRPCTVSVDR